MVGLLVEIVDNLLGCRLLLLLLSRSYLNEAWQALRSLLFNQLPHLLELELELLLDDVLLPPFFTLLSEFVFNALYN